MKAISLWQPWATLIAIGAKRIETRSWATAYTGPLAIHAAKKWSGDLEDLCHSEPFHRALSTQRPNRAGAFYFEDVLKEIVPRGVIVATCKLVGCVQVKSFTLWPDGWISDDFKIPPDEPERCFGDYTPGRFAWLLTDVQPLSEPVPWKGSQGFFDVPDELLLLPADGRASHA